MESLLVALVFNFKQESRRREEPDKSGSMQTRSAEKSWNYSKSFACLLACYTGEAKRASERAFG